MPDAIAYIDGLNLYYGALKDRPALKWLNPLAMVERLVPHEEINLARYFSALTIRTPSDPDASARQAVCFRALRTVPKLVIHEGRMAVRTKTGVARNSTPPRIETIEVFEEKRTDVNIASYMLLDAFEGKYDTAVVVSNDSDLTTPIEMVTSALGKRVITVNPDSAEKLSRELRAAATRSLRTINPTVLRDCQFPDTLTDAQGTIRRHRSYR